MRALAFCQEDTWAARGKLREEEGAGRSTAGGWHIQGGLTGSDEAIQSGEESLLGVGWEERGRIGPVRFRG